MYIRIRKLTSTNKDDDLILNISKTDLIEEVKKIISKKWTVDIAQQKLYYQGKELMFDHRVTDYNIKINDVIQLVVVKNATNTTTGDSKNDKENENPEKSGAEGPQKTPARSKYYEVDDQVDVIDPHHGAWFEAVIIEIYTVEKESAEENDLTFLIRMENARNEITDPIEVKFNDLRPRSHYVYSKSELQADMIVFVNYNIEEPKQLGYWYDFKVTQVEKPLKGVLLVGRDHTEIDDCVIKLSDEVMRIEPVVLLSERDEKTRRKVAKIPIRKLPYYCKKCKDSQTRKCKECGCFVCAMKNNQGTLILCDECDQAYHLKCLDPPLTEVPKDDWYCPQCKNDDSEIVKAGEALKISKKKNRMPSNQPSAKENGGKIKDWGKGMACVGRTSECTLVPKSHFGPIPGVEVGTCWKFRVQVSEAGVHRSPVAGIHGRASEGAYSLALSGGYEDDVDNGNEFYYTGSGGRDLSGNKRVSEQSCNQELTRVNKALALNCNAEFDDKLGADSAKNWQKGKPVRVVRNYKLGKHSTYAPVDGNRYDGIYKVVKYYPEKGKSGYIVWKYLLRRDDPNPAPWEEGGQEMDMIVKLIIDKY